MKRRTHGGVYYLTSIARQIWSHPANREGRMHALGRAAMWQAYKRGVRRPRDLRPYGDLLVRCYPDSTSASNLFYFGPYYEFDEMRFVARYLRPGDGFIDAGANIGTYSLLAASIVGDGGHIEGFEPDPVASMRFAENVERNGLRSIVVHSAALGDHSGSVRMRTTADVSNRVLRGWEREAGSSKVDRVTLDEALAEHGRFALAKLDLEGAETAALRGATRHLGEANPPVWLLEAIDWRLRDLGSSRAELHTLLADHGFDLAVYDGGRAVLEYREPARIGDHSFLAIARSARSATAERLRRPKWDKATPA